MEPKTPRDLRYRNKLFPDAEKKVFKTADGGFVPLPILFRKMLRYLSAAEVRIYLYLLTRVSRYGICYPPESEMAHEIGVSRKNITPHLNSLAEKKLISIRNSGGRNYYLVHDPRYALRAMAHAGALGENDLLSTNELIEDLGLKEIKLKVNAASS